LVWNANINTGEILRSIKKMYSVQRNLT